jgi:hypothetical protein
LRFTCVVCGAVRFDFDIEDFFAGLPIAGDAINAPAAKQLTKIKPLVFHVFNLFIFTFLSSIKAILVRCAHRLLSKLARIFANLADRLL